MPVKSIQYIGIAFAFIFLQSCGTKRFIPENELLYTGGDVEIIADSTVQDVDDIHEVLEQTLRPRANDKFLGMRLGLYFHYKAQRENPGFINTFFNKKIGEEPVYASDVDLSTTEKLILNRLENRGFFNSRVTSEIIKNESKKTARTEYHVKLSRPYTLEKFKLEAVDSLAIYEAINKTLTETLIKPNMRFDLATLKAERNRIDQALKEKGYYNFQPELLIFETDTNRYKSRKFDLYLRLKENIPHKAIIPYKITAINVYPNYVVDSDSVSMDTVRYDQKNFMQDGFFFKPKRLAPFILLEEGEKYNPEASRFTGRRLASIGSYKYVNIRYQQKDSITVTDSLGQLVANIYLSPLKKHAIQAGIQAVKKSNNFAGPGLTLTYSNRNLFKGGEVLAVTGRFSYEAQFFNTQRRGLNSIQVGLNTDLIFPRLLFPVSIGGNLFRYAIPKTKISLGGEYLRRSKLYTLGSLTTSFGYLWRASQYVTHAFNPIVVNFVSLYNTTKKFEAILDENIFLQKSFEQELIAGLTYVFTYSEMDQLQPHRFFLQMNLDVAGNLVSLVSNKKPPTQNTLFGLKYAQYAKVDVDFRYHYNLGGQQTLATRFFAGLGLPYGNSEFMPYSKQYFSGGPYSVRAFRIRSLGPGTYSPEAAQSTTSFFEQTGNIRLEANIEYRFPIISFLKGAIFADAGNVWNTKEIQNLPGGKFSGNFISELGIGVGFGLRVDIQSFVIRFDLAAPIHDPALPEGQRWYFDYKHPILNFAIGYPF